MKRNKSTYSVLFCLLMALVSGCATTSTVSQTEHRNAPLVFSGTRLNVAALSHKPNLKERFGVAPPDYPLLDLPFSGMLDLFVLGYTLPVALFSLR